MCGWVGVCVGGGGGGGGRVTGPEGSTGGCRFFLDAIERLVFVILLINHYTSGGPYLLVQ